MVSCELTDSSSPEAFRIEKPFGFPDVPFPADNEPTEERVALGERLFFDPLLSADNTVSCATCHDPDYAFAEPRKVSVGVQGRLGTRNAPSLMNVAYQPYLLREGGVPTLEMQVLVPVQEHAEFDMNMLDVVERVKQDERYVQMSRVAYDRDPDAWVITRAIASFERTLLSARARFDLFMEHSDPDMLTVAERRGLSLFNSQRTNCSNCHGGYAFTTNDFANNGLYAEYGDNGRERLTGDPGDRALFKIPSLRNVAVTGPYMHDGSVFSLDLVVRHYNSGGKGHANQSPLIRPLGLTSEEQADLVAYLFSLTDQEFWHSPALQ